VRIPLSRTIRDFEFILINHCGHTPWYEKWHEKSFSGFSGANCNINTGS
jgi:hypothetical protein